MTTNGTTTTRFATTPEGEKFLAQASKDATAMRTHLEPLAQVVGMIYGANVGRYPLWPTSDELADNQGTLSRKTPLLWRAPELSAEGVRRNMRLAFESGYIRFATHEEATYYGPDD